MRKMMIVLLVVVMCLCACGGQKQVEKTENTNPSNVEEKNAAPTEQKNETIEKNEPSVDKDLDEGEAAEGSKDLAPQENPTMGPSATEPAETEPSVTEPSVTEPPATEPPATEPPTTEPPATEPVVTQPPVNNEEDWGGGFTPM